MNGGEERGSELRKAKELIVAEMDDDTLRETARLGALRGRGYGFTSEQDLARYVSLMFTFGRDFDTDPACGWARELLTSSREAKRRMTELYARAIRRSKQGRGLWLAPSSAAVDD